MYNCDSVLFDLKSSDEIVGQCLQARAAIEAAQITAQATLQAADVQLKAALIALLAALVAAAFSGLAVYKAAGREARLAEQNHATRQKAYKQLMRTVLAELHATAAFNLIQAEEQLGHFNDDVAGTVNALRIESPKEFAEKNWEQHALLGEEAVTTLHSARAALNAVVQFQREMKGRPWNETSDNPTLSEPEHQPDGSVTFEREFAAVQHKKVNKNLVRELDALRACIEKA